MWTLLRYGIAVRTYRPTEISREYHIKDDKMTLLLPLMQLAVPYSCEAKSNRIFLTQQLLLLMHI